MDISLPFNLKTSDPLTWVIITVGIATAVLVLLLLRLWLQHRSERKLREYVLGELPPLRADPASDSGELETDSEEVGVRALERRSSLRRKGNRVKVFVCPGEDLAAVFEGWVIDRSVGGLALSVPKHIDPGSILSVRTPEAPTTIPWVQVEVKNCRARGRQFEVGCRFVAPVPWNVLLLFG